MLYMDWVGGLLFMSTKVWVDKSVEMINNMLTLVLKKPEKVFFKKKEFKT